MRVGSRAALPGAVVALQVVLGGLFALRTPPWLNPDEPAHYNYVRALDRTGRLPVLQAGDYDHRALRRLVDHGFAGAEAPDSPAIGALRYEFHQPPLYYLAALPVYRVSGGSLVALRVFGVGLGVGVTLLAWGVARRLDPGGIGLPVACTAFVAFVPQHLAGTAAVNNDTLAELLIAAGLLLCLRRWQGAPRGALEQPGLGLVLGLALITKATAYVLAPVVVLAVLGEPRARTQGSLARLRTLAATLGPALGLAAPWWIRNILTYGWPDALGLIRHGAVVVGQPRTAEWIHSYGLLAWLERAVRLGFQSFWAQLGWMSTAVDVRIYLALSMLSALAVVGFLVERRDPRLPLEPGGILLGVFALLVALAALGYNAVFVQHQGRYLFPALVPISVAFVVGWGRAVQPGVADRAGLFLSGVALALAAWGTVRGDWPESVLLLCAVTAGALVLSARGSERARTLVWSAPYVGLPLLDVYVLFRYVGA